jgi:hypothetical protein
MSPSLRVTFEPFISRLQRIGTKVCLAETVDDVDGPASLPWVSAAKPLRVARASAKAINTSCSRKTYIN